MAKDSPSPTKTKKPTPPDAAADMMRKGLELHTVVLRARQSLTEVQAESTEKITTAREAYEELRDIENVVMDSEAEKVAVATEALQAYNDEQAEKLGIPNPLGALGIVPAATGAPTPQVHV